MHMIIDTDLVVAVILSERRNINDVQLGEQPERPVDGGQADLRIPLDSHPIDIAGIVVGVLGDDVEEELTFDGDSLARISESLDNLGSIDRCQGELPALFPLAISTTIRRATPRPMATWAP